jgi:hypothetical protein
MHYDDAEVSLEYVVGLDLGKVSDPSALALLELRDTNRDEDEPTFDVTYLHRWPIGTSYPKIVEGVAKMLQGEPFRGFRPRPGWSSVYDTVQMPTTLAADSTGCGRPVVDMLEAAGLPAHLMPIMITGGHKAHSDHGSYYVPKRILVSTLQVALQTKRLAVAAKLPEAATLAAELQNFQMTITESANDTYEGRQGAHDDLVLAVALALWAGLHGRVRVTKEERELLISLTSYSRR